MSYEQGCPVGLNDNQYVQSSHQIVCWLERAKENVERVLDDLSEFYVLASGDGRILRCNPKMAELVGQDAEELLDVHLSEVLGTEAWAVCQRHLTDLEGQNETRRVDFEVAIPDRGSPVKRLHRWTLALVRDAAKRHDRHAFALVGRDVSLREQWAARWMTLTSVSHLCVVEVDECGRCEVHGQPLLAECFGASTLYIKGALKGQLVPRIAAGLEPKERVHLETASSVVGGPAEGTQGNWIARFPQRVIVSDSRGDAVRDGVTGFELGLRVAPVVIGDRIFRLLLIFQRLEA